MTAMPLTVPPPTGRPLTGRPLTVRLLAEEDAAASRQLGFEAFGVPAPAPTEPATLAGRPGRSWFGAFDADAATPGGELAAAGDVLAARLAVCDFASWFGGAELATAGIAGVTVAAEYRGQGALAPLLTDALTEARDRGAVLSSLFPTAPRIYRRFGYEVVGELQTVKVPTGQLAAVPPATSVGVRRAGPADVDAVRAVYDRWASRQNGPLTRRGVCFAFSAQDYLDGFTGVTVAEDAAGAVQGYASWERGQGYGEQALLEVTDLLADSADGYRALLRALGSFATVTPQATLETSGDDVIRTLLPSLHWQQVHTSPYMLKVLDVPAALTARTYPLGVTADLRFTLAGDVLAGLDGGYRLRVDGGRGSCDRVDPVARTLTPHGLALAFAGTQSSANLRSCGHLLGGDPAEDLSWDFLLGGRQMHIRNYF